jgi:poly-gamma-glutamate capsule biosynthesis protein CapA/YwtB (metallophosphatase superfamily)
VHSSMSDAPSFTTMEINGITVGFLALSDFNVAYDVMPEELADDEYLIVDRVDVDRIAQQVTDAASMCDVLVVSVHWGVDNMPFWTSRQTWIAETCIDNGADLVLGHHPHVLQDTVMYKGKPIVYSMGAFVWDSPLPDAQESAIYVFELSADSAELVETIPVRIEDCRPVVY